VASVVVSVSRHVGWRNGQVERSLAKKPGSHARHQSRANKLSELRSRTAIGGRESGENSPVKKATRQHVREERSAGGVDGASFTQRLFLEKRRRTGRNGAGEAGRGVNESV